MEAWNPRKNQRKTRGWHRSHAAVLNGFYDFRVVQKWAKSGPKMDPPVVHKWAKNGPKVDQKLVHKWAENGPKVDRSRRLGTEKGDVICMTLLRQAEIELEKSGKALAAARRVLDRAQQAHDAMGEVLRQAKAEQEANGDVYSLAAELMADPGIRGTVGRMSKDEIRLVCRAIAEDGSLQRLLQDASEAVQPDVERLERRRYNARRRQERQQQAEWEIAVKNFRARMRRM